MRLTAQIVSAHVSKNQVGVDALPSLIQSVYRSLSTAGEAELAPAPAQTPAVPIKKSVFPDYIVCLEDGKKLKMLKRHLQTSYGLSPDAYRTKWGLPREYPMVAPNYAATRSGLAKQIGLGRKPASDPASEPEPEPEVRRLPAHPEPDGAGAASVGGLDRGLGAGLANQVAVIGLHETEPTRGSTGPVPECRRHAGLGGPVRHCLRVPPPPEPADAGRQHGAGRDRPGQQE